MRVRDALRLLRSDDDPDQFDPAGGFFNPDHDPGIDAIAHPDDDDDDPDEYDPDDDYPDLLDPDDPDDTGTPFDPDDPAERTWGGCDECADGECPYADPFYRGDE